MVFDNRVVYSDPANAKVIADCLCGHQASVDCCQKKPEHVCWNPKECRKQMMSQISRYIAAKEADLEVIRLSSGRLADVDDLYSSNMS